MTQTRPRIYEADIIRVASVKLSLLYVSLGDFDYFL
jgi:hypothetical protein